MSTGTRQLSMLALLLTALVALFVAAEAGQRDLAMASQRVEISAQRAGALADLLQLISQAESSQRGFILLGDPEYLAPFQDSLAKIPRALRSLTTLFSSADPAVRADIDEVGRLSQGKLEEMKQTLDLYRTHGSNTAIGLMRTDVGLWTMTEVSQRIRKIQAAESDQMLLASHSWRNDRPVNLGIAVAVLAASIVLVLLLYRTVVGYLRGKEREAEGLAERGAELESLVNRRTEELSELSSHLQSVAEQEKAALSRELHDELGALLVAAQMDVSWLEKHTPSADPQVQSHFRQLRELLGKGMNLKRRVIENLRPSLLDNLGLLAALRWQVAEACERAGLSCVEHYPEQELILNSEASIAVFRIVQESLTNIIKHAQARNVVIGIETKGKWLTVRIADDGIGLPTGGARRARSHGIAAMRQRALAFGGSWLAARRAGGGTEIEVTLPLERVLAPTPDLAPAPAAAANRTALAISRS